MTPVEPEQVTAEWLTRVLQRAGHLQTGRVESVERRSHLTSEARVTHLAATYSRAADPRAPSRLFLKSARLEQAGNRERAAKEVHFYRDLASLFGPGLVAGCFDAQLGPDGGAFHLLLEDLSPTHYQHAWPLPPSCAQSIRIVTLLAKLHARWWDHPRLTSLVGPEPTRASVEGNAIWIEKTLPRFFDTLGDRLSVPRRQMYERLLAAFRPLGQRLYAGVHRTLVHGDAHQRNFLLPLDGVKDTIRLVDWAAWYVEIASGDLAYLIAVHWYPERRSRMEEALLRRYHSELVDNGVAGYDWDACWYDYRYSVARSLLVPMWQWSSGMSPAVWWGHLERTTAAFDDLDCRELCDGQ